MKQESILRDIIPLIKEFVSIRSTSEDTKALEKILELALSNVKGYTIERFTRNGVKSALIYNSPKRPKKFKIILNGHLDVIPGKEHQYTPHIKDNRLYGVGSMDMKANVVCLMMAFREVADTIRYPLGLQLTTDEETGGFDGTKYQIDKGVRADFVIAGEPTNFDIVHRAKGVLWVEISSKGKTAHGAYPWKGENAILKMNEFLNVLKKKYSIPAQEKWLTTVNVARIETRNVAFNKIPDDCMVGLDIRYIPEDTSTVVRSIQTLLPKGFTFRILAQEPALHTDADNEYVKILQKISGQIIKKKIMLRGAHGSSDARHFVRINCPGIEFGSIGGGIGSDNEWVDIPSLETYYKILKTFLLSIN